MTSQQITDRLAQAASQPASSETQDGPCAASVGFSTEKPCHRDEVADAAAIHSRRKHPITWTRREDLKDLEAWAATRKRSSTSEGGW
jgi:hypothetical protein